MLLIFPVLKSVLLWIFSRLYQASWCLKTRALTEQVYVDEVDVDEEGICWNVNGWQRCCPVTTLVNLYLSLCFPFFSNREKLNRANNNFYYRNCDCETQSQTWSYLIIRLNLQCIELEIICIFKSFKPMYTGNFCWKGGHCCPLEGIPSFCQWVVSPKSHSSLCNSPMSKSKFAFTSVCCHLFHSLTWNLIAWRLVKLETNQSWIICDYHKPS